MLNFSLPTIFMAVFFSNLLIVLVYLILRSLRFTLHTGSRLLFIFLGIIFLRLLFPFELPHCIQVYIPNEPSKYITELRVPLFPSWSETFCFWDIILIFWLCVSIVKAYQLLRFYHVFQKSIHVLGQDITHSEPISSLVDSICEEQHMKNTFQIISMPDIGTPMICGLFNPTILLPETLSISEQELYYVLCHEVFHYKHHDLWIKLGAELLTVIYWWNPVVYLFQKQISNILEVQVDEKIVTMPRTTSLLDYLQCLVHVAQSGFQSTTRFGISLCGESDLKRRMQLIANKHHYKKNKLFQVISTFCVLAVAVLSLSFILEPHHITPEVEQTTFALTPENAFFVINPEGEYDLYKDQDFLVTLDKIDETLVDLPVYQNIEEATDETK